VTCESDGDGEEEDTGQRRPTIICGKRKMSDSNKTQKRNLNITITRLLFLRARRVIGGDVVR
jgi:hypothetical protein